MIIDSNNFMKLANKLLPSVTSGKLSTRLMSCIIQSEIKWQSFDNFIWEKGKEFSFLSPKDHMFSGVCDLSVDTKIILFASPLGSPSIRPPQQRPITSLNSLGWRWMDKFI